MASRGYASVTVQLEQRRRGREGARRLAEGAREEGGRRDRAGRDHDRGDVGGRAVVQRDANPGGHGRDGRHAGAEPQVDAPLQGRGERVGELAHAPEERADALAELVARDLEAEERGRLAGSEGQEGRAVEAVQSRLGLADQGALDAQRCGERRDSFAAGDEALGAELDGEAVVVHGPELAPETTLRLEEHHLAASLRRPIRDGEPREAAADDSDALHARCPTTSAAARGSGPG